MDSSPDLSLKLRRGSNDSRDSYYMDFAQGIDSDIEEVATIAAAPPCGTSVENTSTESNDSQAPGAAPLSPAAVSDLENDNNNNDDDNAELQEQQLEIQQQHHQQQQEPESEPEDEAEIGDDEVEEDEELENQIVIELVWLVQFFAKNKLELILSNTFLLYIHYSGWFLQIRKITSTLFVIKKCTIYACTHFS